MNKKALMRLFAEISKAYRGEAYAVISESATNREGEENACKLVDRQVKRWQKRLERLTKTKDIPADFPTPQPGV